MSNICLIRQPAGLGDIFFCQKIGEYYKNQGYRVIWPVSKVFSYVDQYLKNFEYPCVEENFPYKDIFLDTEHTKEIIKGNDFLFIPLHGHNLRDQSVMRSKYLLNALSFHDWDKYFNFERNYSRENILYYKLLRLEDNEPYTLLNNMFDTPPNVQIKPIPLEKYSSSKIIRMELIPQITLFDWCKVIENATNILTVDTAINYIIDKLQLKATNLQLYSRYTPTNYSQIKGIFKTKWKYN